jgi:D-arabinose 1-dehydrogenase-like Zn-dependent alcohol dehydrogenase
LAPSASELRACVRYSKSDEGRFTTGGKRETQEMLDFCGQHNITAGVEVIPIQKINEV